MKVKKIDMKPLIHLATISFSASLAIASIPGLSTRLDANPAPTNQGVSSQSHSFGPPKNIGTPEKRGSGATRGNGNDEEGNIDPSAEGASAAAAVPTNPTDRLLAQWGWSKTTCQQGSVFITGIGAETVCVNPTSGVAAGHYTYNQAKNQLIPIDSQPPVNSQPTQRRSPSNRIL